MPCGCRGRDRGLRPRPGSLHGRQTAHFSRPCDDLSGQHQFRYSLIHRRKLYNVIDKDVLIHFVDRRVYRTEFDYVCSRRRNETAVGRSATGGQFRCFIRLFTNSLRDRFGKFACVCEKRFARQMPVQLVVNIMCIEDGVHSGFECLVIPYG